MLAMAAGTARIAPQLVANLDHRRECMAHIEEPGAQAVDAFDLFPRRHHREKIVLDDFKLVGDLVDGDGYGKRKRTEYEREG